MFRCKTFLQQRHSQLQPRVVQRTEHTSPVQNKKRIVLIFSPTNPASPRHGAHLRIIQQISSITQVAEVVLASCSHASDTDWPPNLRETAGKLNVSRIEIYERSKYRLFEFIASPIKAIEWLSRIARLTNSNFNLSRAVRRYIRQKWFKRLTTFHDPVAVVINYPYWGYLVDDLDKRIFRILEPLDLIEINQHLQSEVIQQLIIDQPNATLQRPTDSFSYISSLEQLPENIRDRLAIEISVYSKFNLIWSISERDTKIAKSIDPILQIETILPSPSNLDSTTIPRQDFALLPIGPNVFNLYSTLLFISEIEPLISYPSEGRILVTGASYLNLSVSYPPRVTYLGLIHNFDHCLASARFVIAPTAVGTGQQVKIFEALWRGTPVICFRSAVPSLLKSIIHGLVLVDTQQEFADAMSRMWNDEPFYQSVLQGIYSFKQLMRLQISHADSLSSSTR